MWVWPPDGWLVLVFMRLDLQLLRQSLSEGRGFAGQPPPGVVRCAAVAAIVRPSAAGAELLLIRRARDARDPWSGHMALPGGHRERGDLDLVATALRETHEEVGLKLNRDAEWLGALERARAIGGGSGFEILPLVFALARKVEDAELIPNPSEVDAIVWARLEDLLLPAAHTNFTHSGSAGEQRHFPAFDVKGHIVWGLTYRILRNLLAVWGHGHGP